MKFKKMIVAVGMAGLACNAMATPSTVAVNVTGLKGGTPTFSLDIPSGSSNLQFIYEDGRDILFTKNEIPLVLTLGAKDAAHNFGYRITAKADDNFIESTNVTDNSAVGINFKIGSVDLTASPQDLLYYNGSAMDSNVSEWDSAIPDTNGGTYTTNITASVGKMKNATGDVTTEASELGEGDYSGTATIEFDATWSLMAP
ncbi:MAG: hypothetical protein ACRCU9_11265 [Iodobacter sp.]